MPEPTTPDPSATQVVEPVITPTPDPKDEVLGEGGLKALNAERDARKAAESRIAEFEAKEAEAEKAKLGDIERAQAEATEAAKARDAAAAELARYKVAAKHKITDEEDLELLATATDEAAMERLAARIAPTSQTPGTPKPDPSGGARSEKTGTLAEQIAAAEKAGDKGATASLKAQQLGALANNQT